MSEAMTRADVEQYLYAIHDPRNHRVGLKIDALLSNDAALRQEIERLTAERDEATRQLHVEQLLNTNGHRQLEDAKIALVQAEQERDRLREQLAKVTHQWLPSASDQEDQ